jgi:hypothetical protein
MARPKRMGVYNALDDLLPGGVWGNPEGSPSGSGPAWDPGPPWDPDAAGPTGEPAPPSRRPRLEPVPDPARPSRPWRRGEGGRRGANALDDLLPGPRDLSDPPPGPRVPPGRSAGRAGRHLGVWNPLDGPPPAQPVPARAAPPAKARVSFRLPADLVETARDAVAHLAGTADRTTLTALTERALRVELARLAITHNHGQPFPLRDA